MGTSRVGLSVADAGPLIHLAEIGGLALLRICEAVRVPSAVWQETVGRGRVSEQILLAQVPIQQTSVASDELEQFIQNQAISPLHEGEQHCLFVCMKDRIPVLLTDDMAARDTAKRMGVRPVGSLGVVARAYRVGDVTLDEAELHISNLQRVSTLFVTGALVDFVLDELRRFKP